MEHPEFTPSAANSEEKMSRTSHDREGSQAEPLSPESNELNFYAKNKAHIASLFLSNQNIPQSKGPQAPAPMLLSNEAPEEPFLAQNNAQSKGNAALLLLSTTSPLAMHSHRLFWEWLFSSRAPGEENGIETTINGLNYC